MNTMQEGRIKLGTSGIVLPGAKTTFPPEFQATSRLHYYASLFNSLEINSSFYKIPMPKTFAKWALEVPDNFSFTVKLWQGITHERQLQYNPSDMDKFMDAANQLADKAGCILIQFPASITVKDLTQVEKIIAHLTKLNKQQWHVAIELRHMSWYQDVAYAMFNCYHLSVVFHDMPASRAPLDHDVPFVYVRFHGPSGNYQGHYSDAVIRDYANRIQAWSKNKKDVYVYFNNTIDGALENAQAMQALLG